MCKKKPSYSGRIFRTCCLELFAMSMTHRPEFPV